MATTLDMYYQNKQQLNAIIAEHKLTMDQLLVIRNCFTESPFWRAA